MQFLVSALALLSAATAATAAPVFCNVVMSGKPVSATLQGTFAGLELAKTSTGGATLASHGQGFNTQIKTTDGGLGFFRGCHYDWMNIGSSDRSYKPITFDLDTQKTHNWIVGTDGALTAAATSEYQQTNHFLACDVEGHYTLYLQTGSDMPSAACVPTTLHVPTN